MLFHDCAVVELWLLYYHGLLKTMCICHVMTLELLLIHIIVLHAHIPVSTNSSFSAMKHKACNNILLKYLNHLARLHPSLYQVGHKS
jgi:hypothetical protein